MDLIIAFVLVLIVSVACCFFSRNCPCDGGVVQSVQSESTKDAVERKIRYQIRKMVATEKEIKRLAVLATSGTEEDPNEYIMKVRNIIFPPVNSTTTETGFELEQVTNSTPNGEIMQLYSLNSIQPNATDRPEYSEMNADLNFYDEGISFNQYFYSNSANDNNVNVTDEMPPSYEDCMRGTQLSYV